MPGLIQRLLVAVSVIVAVCLSVVVASQTHAYANDCASSGSQCVQVLTANYDCNSTKLSGNGEQTVAATSSFDFLVSLTAAGSHFSANDDSPNATFSYTSNASPNGPLPNGTYQVYWVVYGSPSSQTYGTWQNYPEVDVTVNCANSPPPTTQPPPTTSPPPPPITSPPPPRTTLASRPTAPTATSTRPSATSMPQVPTTTGQTEVSTTLDSAPGSSTSTPKPISKKGHSVAKKTSQTPSSGSEIVPVVLIGAGLLGVAGLVVVWLRRRRNAV